MAETTISRQNESAFQVTGGMTFATTRKLLAESKALFQLNKNLNLDLSRVEQADSAGLALLLEWVARAREKGVEVSVRGMPESLLAIARLCHIEYVLESLSVKKGGKKA